MRTCPSSACVEQRRFAHSLERLVLFDKKIRWIHKVSTHMAHIMSVTLLMYDYAHTINIVIGTTGVNFPSALLVHVHALMGSLVL